MFVKRHGPTEPNDIKLLRGQKGGEHAAEEMSASAFHLCCSFTGAVEVLDDSLAFPHKQTGRKRKRRNDVTKIKTKPENHRCYWEDWFIYLSIHPPIHVPLDPPI